MPVEEGSDHWTKPGTHSGKLTHTHAVCHHQTVHDETTNIFLLLGTRHPCASTRMQALVRAHDPGITIILSRSAIIGVGNCTRCKLGLASLPNTYQSIVKNMTV